MLKIVGKLYVLNASYETLDKDSGYTHVTIVSFDEDELESKLASLEDEYYGVIGKIEAYDVDELTNDFIIIQKIKEEE